MREGNLWRIPDRPAPIQQPPRQVGLFVRVEELARQSTACFERCQTNGTRATEEGRYLLRPFGVTTADGRNVA